MSLSKASAPSTFTKMRQVYWEAKQSFNKSLGNREDSNIISSDSELDIKLELLRTADNYFNSLMRVLLDYRKALEDIVNTQDSLGMALIGYGTKDSTAAGKVMCTSGKAISRAAQRQSQLKTPLMNLFHEVETFQFKATADALQTASKMEKVRRSYRSGLMWLKKESTDVDPDVSKKLKNYRRVQEHIKRLKIRFDGVKLECMQKIDLFLLSRSNLFSHSVIPYTKTFKKTCKYSVFCMGLLLKNTSLCLSYNFVALKELNQCSNTLQKTLSDLSLYRTPAKRKNKRSAEKRDTVISDKSYAVHSANSKNSESVELLVPQVNCSGDAKLIDLSEEEMTRHPLKKTSSENSNPHSSSKYSDDLLPIKLDDYKPYGNGFSFEKFDSKFEYSMLDFAYPENRCDEESNLHFWTLIQSASEASELPQNKISEAKSTGSITPKKWPGISTESKWNEILGQFDPFLDNSKQQNKIDAIELC